MRVKHPKLNRYHPFIIRPSENSSVLSEYNQPIMVHFPKPYLWPYPFHPKCCTVHAQQITMKQSGFSTSCGECLSKSSGTLKPLNLLLSLISFFFNTEPSSDVWMTEHGTGAKVTQPHKINPTKCIGLSHTPFKDRMWIASFTFTMMFCVSHWKQQQNIRRSHNRCFFQNI